MRPVLAPPTAACPLPPSPKQLLNQVRDSLGRLVELPIDTHPGHYRKETATIHSSAIVRLASKLRSIPPGEGAQAAAGAPAGWGACGGRCMRLLPGVVLSCCVPAPAPPAPFRPAPGSTLFLEIKHWKSDKRRFSTLAWSAVPLDRLVDTGQHAARVRSRPGLLVFLFRREAGGHRHGSPQAAGSAPALLSCQPCLSPLGGRLA